MTTNRAPRQSQAMYFLLLVLAAVLAMTGIVLDSVLGWGLFVVGLFIAFGTYFVLRRQRLRGTGIYRER